MGTENDERIKFLEKRVKELQNELAEAKSPSIFMKVLISLTLIGVCFAAWKSWGVMKWVILAGIIWFFLGDNISSAWNSTSSFLREIPAQWQASSKANAIHDREMERIRIEAEAANSRIKAEADATNSRVSTESNSKMQIINAEENAKRAEWEREQASKRNDAVNDAIRAGTWHSNTPETQPIYSAPTPATTSTPIPKPTVTRTREGNTTRVLVKF